MKFAFLALVLVPSQVRGDELRLGFYDEPADAAIFKIAAQADRELAYYHKSGEFELNLVKISNGESSSIHFTFEEISNFLRLERHKGLIVIWFGKALMHDEDVIIRKTTEEVVKQMTEVGYKRVVILGNHSQGVYYLADTALQSRRPEQGVQADATKPGN